MLLILPGKALGWSPSWNFLVGLATRFFYELVKARLNKGSFETSFFNASTCFSNNVGEIVRPTSCLPDDGLSSLPAFSAATGWVNVSLIRPHAHPRRPRGGQSGASHFARPRLTAPRSPRMIRPWIERFLTAHQTHGL